MEDNSLLRTDKELAEMYQRNVNSVYKLSYIYLKNIADAEDAVQSVFLKLLQKNMRFNDCAHEKAWFITTTKNHCKDILKSWWRQRCVDFETLSEMASQDQNPEETELTAKLLDLSEKYRVVLYLYYLEEYSVREIAGLLGRNESTIQSQLQRGREKLKIELGGKGFGSKNDKQDI